MTLLAKTRNKWNRVNGLWTISLGSRGSRIRLFENTNGVYYRDDYSNGRKVRKSLRTRSKTEAERLGKLLLSRLLSGQVEEASAVVTLSSLWSRFQAECEAWRDNSERSRKDDERSAKVLMGFFGESQDVSYITANDVVRFQNARKNGGIKLLDGELTKKVRARTGQADLELLRMMCRWATNVRVGGNGRLLLCNPLQGVKFSRELNERQPPTSMERFTKTREAMIELRGRGESETGRLRWMKVELALVLAEATGRRLNSIRLLRWEDVDLKQSEIRWRADSDKKGKEWVIPIPDSLRDELRQFRTDLCAIAGWVFPSETDAEEPMARSQFDKWLLLAERHAKLDKLQGGRWHPYRRKWATERKHLSIKDVMAAGGWSDADTLVTRYQQADRATLLSVMSEPRKLSEAVVS